MSNEKEIEKEIVEKGLVAPRLTLELIDETIVGEDYHVFPGSQLTVCCLTLRNGFTVTGESACVSPGNFDVEIGRKIARGNARDKIWALEGYLLKERLYLYVDSESEKVLSIAQVCHEVNRGYCEALGDKSQVEWDEAPQWQVDSACVGVELHLKKPDAGAEASHESWMKQKLSEGWVYGTEKNAELKTHHCLVPFSELPLEQQAKDYIFRAVVHALAGEA